MFWKYSCFVLFIGLASCSLLKDSPPKEETSTSLRLFYTEPAQNWMEEALPIGNGYMGV